MDPDWWVDNQRHKHDSYFKSKIRQNHKVKHCFEKIDKWLHCTDLMSWNADEKLLIASYTLGKFNLWCRCINRKRETSEIDPLDWSPSRFSTLLMGSLMEGCKKQMQGNCKGHKYARINLKLKLSDLIPCLFSKTTLRTVTSRLSLFSQPAPQYQPTHFLTLQCSGSVCWCSVFLSVCLFLFFNSIKHLSAFCSWRL